MTPRRRAAVLAAAALLGAGCLAVGSRKQARRHRSLERAVPAIATPAGTRAILVAQGFTYPSAFDFDAEGNLYVLESHTVPIPLLKPRIVRVDEEGEFRELKLEGDDAPSGTQAVGLTHHDGWLYVSHEEKDATWGISRVRPQGGRVEAVVRGVPSRGDHWPNYLAFGPDGSLFYGVGSATNSGVISSHDAVNLKWLKKRPEVHDVACADIVLTGETFLDRDEIGPDVGEEVATGAYQPYRQHRARGAKGASPCTSSLYRLAPGSRTPELWAWGFRNPVGVAVSPDGEVFVAMQGADIRGTRPIRDDPDSILRVRKGSWLGWPDHSAALVPYSDPRHLPEARFLAKGKAAHRPLIDRAASGLPEPDRAALVAATTPHAAVCGMVHARGLTGALARLNGKLLVAEMGDFRPVTDPEKPEGRDGFLVAAVDPRSGATEVIARNAGHGPPRPASDLKLADGLERPVDVRVGADGALYVLDFGVFVATEGSGKVLPKTGKLFRIESSR